MNSTQLNGANNLKVFFGCVALALVLLCSSGLFLYKSLNGNSGDMSEATKACLSAMRANGFNPQQPSDDFIKVLVATTSQLEPLTYKSGVIVANCPGFELKNYCAGTGCQNPGVSFTLVKKK